MVVIGSGLGGLCCAAMLASYGLQVMEDAGLLAGQAAYPAAAAHA